MANSVVIAAGNTVIIDIANSAAFAALAVRVTDLETQNGSNGADLGGPFAAVTGGSAPFTATVGRTVPIDMSTGTPVIDLVITLPTGVMGDYILFAITGIDATYGVEFIGTIGSESYSSGGKYRMSSLGDHVKFTYINATIGWVTS